MKAKIRMCNLGEKQKSALDDAVKEYVVQNAKKFEDEIKYRIIENTLAAVCLALSDQHGFGAKRIQRVIDGVIEILEGNADDVYRGHKTDAPGENAMLDAMLAELEARGICIVIQSGGVDILRNRRIESQGEA